MPEFRHNYAVERAAPDTFRVRFWRAFDRWAPWFVLLVVFVAAICWCYWLAEMYFPTPTLSGIQHAALPCLVIRCPLSQLIATIKAKLAQ